MLPTTLSRGKTLPISLDNCSQIYSCMLVSDSCCIAGTGRWEGGGAEWRAAGSGVVKPRRQKAESPSSTHHRTSCGIPKRICEKEWFWLEERRKRVR